jgi:hypothetical protein
MTRFLAANRVGGYHRPILPEVGGKGHSPRASGLSSIFAVTR